MSKDPLPAAELSAWDLMEDDNFRGLLSRFARGCISWDDFLALPQPRDTSPMRTWDLLGQMSRCMGVELPIPDLEDNEYWYRRTYELTDAVNRIARACSTDSHLYRTVSASAGAHFLVKMRIEETIAATRLDGLAVPEEDADVLLRFDRTPGNATERLIMNTFLAIDHLPDLVAEPFSRDLFRDLRELLLEGVNPGELRTTPAPLALAPFDYNDETTEKFADRQLDSISAYANHETGDEQDHAVLRALLMADAFRFYRPLKEVSNQVGRLAAHLYALKHDLPVLGWVPVSKAKADWTEGRIVSPEVSYDREGLMSLRKHSLGDLTGHQTLSAQLTLLALRDITAYIEKWDARNEELRVVLQKDPLLNDRQRAILGRALRSPDAEFEIRYHKTHHNVAYTTARRDFLELAEKGYLTLTQRGKAFVFLAAPGLQDLV